MNDSGIDHIALQVESLSQAENLYTALFDMVVVERGAREVVGEADTTLPVHNEERPNCSVLERAGLRLVLRRVIADFAGPGRLGHVCIRVPDSQVKGLLDRAESLGCVVRVDHAGRTGLEDPYEIRWEIEKIETSG
jgi:catechol 2,3-dioxygenase-like lactoylglutathione lyase family enzyme